MDGAAWVGQPLTPRAVHRAPFRGFGGRLVCTPEYVDIGTVGIDTLLGNRIMANSSTLENPVARPADDAPEADSQPDDRLTPWSPESLKPL